MGVCEHMFANPGQSIGKLFLHSSRVHVCNRWVVSTLLGPGGTAKQSIDPANVPAGDPSIVRCPRGTWTQGMGAALDSLCREFLVPAV